jgi:hypothetical protein
MWITGAIAALMGAGLFAAARLRRRPVG